MWEEQASYLWASDGRECLRKMGLAQVEPITQVSSNLKISKNLWLAPIHSGIRCPGIYSPILDALLAYSVTINTSSLSVRLSSLKGQQWAQTISNLFQF